MKNRKGRLIGFLLAAVLAVGLVPAAHVQEAKADPGVVYTHDVDKVKELLESDGDVHIVLDDKTQQTIKGYVETGIWWNDPTWCDIGPGEKILDLNGNLFEIDLDDARLSGMYEQTVTLFAVPSGAKLTINDSSANNSGKICFDGWLHEVYIDGCLICSFSNSTVIHRNGFLVDGGELVFNGGVLVGGRSKEQWVTAALRDTNLTKSDWSWNIHLGEVDTDKIHTGYVRQQVNCDGITINDGTVIINGGVIQGRGFRDMRMVDTGLINIEFQYERAAGIYMRGGRLIINDGVIWGMGGADVLDVAGDVTIRAGRFYNHTIDYCLIPGVTLPTTLGYEIWAESCAWYTKPGYGKIGIPASALDSDYVKVKQNKDWLPVSEWSYDTLTASRDSLDVVSRTDRSFTLYNETYGEPVGKNLAWDGETDVVISADIAMYWPLEEIPYNSMGGTPLIHYPHALAQSSKDLGVTSAITISGMTVSQGGEMTTIEKQLTTVDLVDMGAGKLSFHLKDLLPDGLSMGSSFLVTVRYGDVLYQSTVDPSNASMNLARFSVQLKENDLEILQNPASQSVYTKGDTVTLTASAANAKGAYWEQIYPSSTSEGLSGTFDSSTGTATLIVPVNSYARYVCCFTNGMGIKKTGEAAVSVIPSPNLPEGDVKEVTWFTSSAACYLNTGIGDNGSGQRWYYRAGETDEWTQLSKIEGKMDPNLYSGTLAVKYPELSEAGYYRMEADYDTGSGTVTVKSGIFHVTVVDTPKEEIYDVYIHGFEDLYVGDQAPGVSELWVDDSRVAITNVTWSGCTDSSGKITSSTGMVTVTLAVTDDAAVFETDDEGHFTVHLGERTATKVPPLMSHKNIEISYTYTPTNGLPVPHESVLVNSGTSFTFQTGEDVDIQLDFEVEESERPKASGVSHVTGLTADTSASGKLPDGLSLVQDGDGTWHIRGTIAEDASLGQVRSPIYFSLADDNGISTGTCTAVFTFMITPKISTFSLPETVSELFHEHAYGAWTDVGDGQNHRHICDGCGSEEAQPHLWDDGVVMTPETVTAAGVMTYTCLECGAVRTETIPAHVLEKYESTASTCTAQGFPEHYECKDCGAFFEDAGGTKLIEDGYARLLPLAEHTWGEWTVTKEATASEDGEKERVCSVCGAKETEAIKYDAVYYSISLNLNGGTWDGKTGTVTLSIEEGQTLTLPKPTREGYTFDYWEGSRYEAGANYIVKENHNFTAQWKQNGKTDGNAAPGQNTNNPGTGDNNHTGLWVALIAVAAAAAAGAGVVVKKRR
ncbi:MAG: InlB B-repeat-containing protein [Eubacterium sp.]|nr:InlB B-repeat-containing protein [Eubacterium sp.]